MLGCRFSVSSSCAERRGLPMRTVIRLLLATAFLVSSAASGLGQSTYEINVDRPGADYSNFAIRGGPRACQLACADDGDCRAWTYVRRGYQGRSARCWLKSDIPGSVPSPCCVSGVVR
ncbi:MAG: PAN domain-containing protein [Methylobacteriaceae bacterium]|nr:PAN domain-containing protein [Methylobacteriaceae bacterium]MCC0003057.1 PAN domain-containing protein [Methylobacteriaceae bacterium]